MECGQAWGKTCVGCVPTLSRCDEIPPWYIHVREMSMPGRVNAPSVRGRRNIQYFADDLVRRWRLVVSNKEEKGSW